MTIFDLLSKSKGLTTVEFIGFTKAFGKDIEVKIESINLFDNVDFSTILPEKYHTITNFDWYIENNSELKINIYDDSNFKEYNYGH